MRAVMVVNPRSGRNTGRKTADRAGRVLEAFWDLSVVETAGPDDAQRLSREAAQEGAELVLACGGDGTLSQCVVGLEGSAVPCGLVPSGTGNDFARAAGIPHDPGAAAAYALRGRPRPVDLLDVNHGAFQCLNITGCGLDAAIAERMNRRTRLTGGITAYLPAIIAEVLGGKPMRGCLTVDGERLEGEWMLVAFANAQSYGAGMRIAPEARYDDGLMDVIAVGALSRLEILRCLPMLRAGRHTLHPAVRCWKARRASLVPETNAPVVVDGDVALHGAVSVEVRPGAGLLWLADGA